MSPRIEIIVPHPYTRYAIQRKGRYWTGSAWVTDRRQALLYADTKPALHDLLEIEEQGTKGMKTIRFVAPVALTIHSPGEIDLQNLKNYLQENVGVRVAPDIPTPNDIVIGDIEVDWQEMKGNTP